MRSKHSQGEFTIFTVKMGHDRLRAQQSFPQGFSSQQITIKQISQPSFALERLTTKPPNKTF